MSESLTPLADLQLAGWNFDNTYGRLPESFYSRVQPTPVSQPRMVLFNPSLASSLGLNPAALNGADAAALFAGNQIPEGADPIAQAYAGHQFGNLARLGDGRAILMGEHLDPAGHRYDIQWKGAGPTPYSRCGDGRAALGPMLREYLISEAMHALGIPTTRSLAVVASGEPVFREQTLPGAILIRVAASHIRVGTYEYFAALGDTSSLRLLAEHTVQRHFPERANDENLALGLLEAVQDSQAALIARWMHVGFVHGVMNTDNVALSGETLDYGPCAFLDTYNPAQVFSSIDRQGRYAFGRQPQIAAWNLARFAEALLPILHSEPESALALASNALATFPDRFQRHWLAGMRHKVGLFNEEPTDLVLIEDLLNWLHHSKADFTRTFRNLPLQQSAEPSKSTDPAFAAWLRRWLERLDRQNRSQEEVLRLMSAHNPAVIPRNHEVESALAAATADNDLAPMHRLLEALATPYDATGKPGSLTNPPPPGSPPYRTYCGT